jgi:hypothetical protein
VERPITGYHREEAGGWIAEQGGRLRFSPTTTPTIDVEAVEPLGAVRCSVESFAVDRGGQVGTEESQCDEPVADSGDPACWAGLACPECDAVVAGGTRRPGFPATGAIP